MNLRSVLFKIQLEVTSRCNAKCPMCFPHFKNKKKIDMDFDTFKTIIDELERSSITDEVLNQRKKHLSRIPDPRSESTRVELKAMSEGKIPIYFYGIGEPLLHPRIVDMLEYVQNKGFYTVISTNAQLLDERMIDKLKNLVQRMNISIDSVEKKSYEQIRHGLDFDVVMKNVDRLIEKNSKDQIIEITAVNLGQDIDRIKKHFHKKETSVCIKEDVRDNIGYPIDYECQKIKHSCFIDSQGNVRVCCFDYNDDTLLGNLNKKNLLEIWQSPKHLKLITTNGDLAKIPICKKACITS